MFDENQFIHWMFKHDNNILFVIFCMRIARCNQSAQIKQHILNKGLEIIQERLQQKIQHWQEKRKLNEISVDFHQKIEKTIRKTLSYQYPSDTISDLIKNLIEIYIKDGNPQGILHYINKISNTVNSLIPASNKEAQRKFSQFWTPIEQYTYSFVPQYYRGQINQSSPMIALMSVLSSIALIAMALIFLKEISLTTGLWVIGGAIMTNYLSRSTWRLTAFIQHKASLSGEALQESNRILLDLIGLEQIPHASPKKQKEKQIQESLEKEVDLLPVWHQKTSASPVQDSHKENHNKPKRKRSTTFESTEQAVPVPPMVDKVSSVVIKWKQVSPPATYDAKHPEDSNAHPFYSSRFTYTPLFARLNPSLAQNIPKKDFDHFQKIVERGRLIPSKSKGIQGIKPAFREYKNLFGKTAFSDYKLKIPGKNGQVFGHEVAAIRLENRDYTLVDFDGYDPKAHETLDRKYQ